MFDINSNILTKSGYSAGQLQQAESVLRPGYGYHQDVWQAIVDAENTYDLNALFILAHADVESAHGTSYYATTRNNLFGFNAVDSDPDLASTYASQSVSVHDYADFLNNHYLHEGQTYYGGTSGDGTGVSAHSIFVHYSSSHDAEAETVVGIMNNLASHIGSAPAPQPVNPPQPTGNTYTVAQGDNMSVIAGREGITLAQLEQMNPSAGHPAGNFGVIWPGDVLNVPHPNSAPPVTAPASYYTVVSGDNLSTIAENNGLSLAQIESMNPNAGHPAGNYGNIWPGDQIRIK